ncbi:hypothetical protein YB2330_000816 [Saitoella coloradoensis]
MSTNITIILSPTQKYTTKPSPTSSLNSLLIQACQHLNLPNPPESYLLKYGKTTLDLSLPIRHANLPHGAKIDMIQRPAAAGAATALVTIAVQLPDGKRLIKKFPASTSLWDVLKANQLLQLQDSGRRWMEPVVRIGNDDDISASISGMDALKRTTLSSRGLFSGQHIVKVSFRLSTEPVPPIDDIDSPAAVMGVAVGTPTPTPTTATNPPPPPPPTATAPGPNPPSRSLKIYNPPTSSTPHAATLPPTPDIPPTPADAHAIQASLTARARALDNGGLFLPAAERAKRALALNPQLKAPDVTEMEIGVRLPDGARVCATFGVNEPARAIFELVRSSLRDDVAAKKFHLRVGMPPKKVLEGWSGGVTIGEALGAGVARCLVTLVWDEAGNSGARESVLREELVERGRELKGKVVVEDDVDVGVQMNDAPEATNANAEEPKKERKIPAWLMKGLKK